MPGPDDEGPTIRDLVGEPDAYATRADLAGLADQLNMNFGRLSQDISDTLKALSDQMGATAAEALASHAEAIRRQEQAIAALISVQRRLETEVVAIKAVLGLAQREGIIEIRTVKKEQP